MNTKHAIDPTALPNLRTLRELLDLLASLRDFSDPFGSPDALRNAIELLMRLSVTLGLDPKWLTWLVAIHDHPELVDLVLAVGRFLESLINRPQGGAVTAQARRRPSQRRCPRG